MVDRRDSDPQFPQRTGGSLLRTAIAATPLAVGATVSLRGIHVDGSLKQPIESGIDQAMRRTATTRRQPRIPSIEDMNRFMRGQSEGINRQAWQWASGSVDPFTQKKLLSFTEHISTMTDPEIRSSIIQTMQRNQSRTMERVWKTFESNVSQLSRMDTLPAFVPVTDLQAFMQKQTVPLATSMPEDLFGSMKRIAKKLGGTAQSFGVTTPTLASDGFGVWNLQFKGTDIGDFKVQLPQIVGGIMHEGTGLQTRRIAPDILLAGEEGLQRMGRAQFFMKELEEQIVPDIGTRLKTQEQLQSAVKQLRGRIFGELEAVPAVDPSIRTAAAAQREALRGKAIQVVKPADAQGYLDYRPGYKTPTASEISKVMTSPEGRAMGLRGGVGPKGLSKGILSTADWERMYLGDVDYSRRPEQRYREFQVTEESMQALGQHKKSQKYKALQMIGDDIAYSNVARPKLKAMYVDPERFMTLMERQAMGEGEAVMRAKTGQMLQFQEAKTMKLLQAREDIADFSKLNPGDILGRSPEGKIVTLPKGAQAVGMRGIPGEAAHLDILQTHQFRHGDKIFGGAKAVTLFRSEKEFGNFVSQIGGGEADMIINMDELRKNKSLHKSQIISSLENLVQGGAPGGGLTRKFWAGEGEAIGRQWAQRASTHKGFIQKAMTQSIQAMDISPGEFGRVFGASGHVLGDQQQVAKMIRTAAGDMAPKKAQAFIRAATRGVAGGMADIAFGGPRLETGGLGSLEPRAFDILKTGGLGTTGESVSQEFLQRLAYTTPEAEIAGMEIGKTLESLTGKGTTVGPTWRPGTDFQKFIEAGGGMIKPGKGQPSIYVPGADVMQQLRPYETPTGVNVRGAISDVYHNIATQSAAFQEGELTTKEFKRQMSYSARELLREAAPGGKGAGSIMRGKMIGSRFLRGVSTMGGADSAIRDARAIGITEAAFSDMVGELEESGMYKQEAVKLQEMRDRFMSGKSVSGFVGRHPMIGEFSIQPAEFRKVEGSKDLMVLPEIRQNIRVRTALTNEFKEKSLTLGPLVGMAGDKDADAYSAMLLSPRNEEAVRKNIMQADSEFASRYTQHQVRMQLFKAGKGRSAAGMTTVGEMIANVEKLRSGQEWIAPLSMELTSAKRSLTSFGKGQASADARFLLEWLEQTPISAKHMTAQQAAGGGLESLMTSITESMRERNVDRLRGNIETIVKDDAVAKSMLTSDIFMDTSSARQLTRITGTQVQERAAGININAALGELMRTMDEGEATGAARQTELLSGRGARVKMREIAELSAKGAFSAAQEGGGGMFRAVSSATTEASNKLGAMGRGIIRHHKAIGLGFAGSLALSAMLSEPPQTVGTGKALIPDAKSNMYQRKAANKMKPEDLHPPGQSVGRPQAPQMMRNQNVRLNNGGPRMTGARVSARLPQGANVSNLTSGMAGLGRNTSVNLRDNRANLHPHEIGSKLF